MEEKLNDDVQLNQNIMQIDEKKLNEEIKNHKLNKIKFLQDKIEKEKLIINEYDSKLEKIKEQENLPILTKTKDSISNSKHSMNQKINIQINLLSKLRLKTNSLNISLNDLKKMQNSLEIGSSLDIQDKNIRRDKLRDIKKEKEIIQNKIKEIDNQIKIIIDNENSLKNSRASLQRNYTKYIEEQNFINKKVSALPNLKIEVEQDLNLLENNLEKKEEEEKENKKKEKYQTLRKKELDIIHQRKNKMDIKARINTIKYVAKKNYITAEEKEQKRLIEEEAYMQKVLQKRKLKLQPISKKELDKFSREVQRNERLVMSEVSTKKMQLNQLWKERKNLIPKYKSKFYETNVQNENKTEEEEFLRKERIKQEVIGKMKYQEEVNKKFRPTFNINLKNERENKIKKLHESNKYHSIRELEDKLKEMSSKITKSQPKNYKLDNKFQIKEDIKKLIPLKKPKDYLVEKRLKQHLTPNTTDLQLNKWDNMLNSGGNMYDNIEQIKLEAQLMQEKADAKRKLLKNKNVKYDDELNNEITNLYMGSIQAKLGILKKIGN